MKSNIHLTYLKNRHFAAGFKFKTLFLPFQYIVNAASMYISHQCRQKHSTKKDSLASGQANQAISTVLKPDLTEIAIWGLMDTGFHICFALLQCDQYCFKVRLKYAQWEFVKVKVSVCNKQWRIVVKLASNSHLFCPLWAF